MKLLYVYIDYYTYNNFGYNYLQLIIYYIEYNGNLILYGGHKFMLFPQRNVTDSGKVT